MIKLYKQNRQTQIDWMKKNPGKTVTLNVILVVLYFIWLERAELFGSKNSVIYDSDEK